MGPSHVSEALRLIAESIDSDGRPSRSAVAADLSEVLALLGSPDSFGKRVAILDSLKRLKRKVLNTKGESKTLEKIDRLKALRKKCKPLAKAIMDGEDFSDIAADADYASIVHQSAGHIGKASEGMDGLKEAKKEYEAVAALGEMDEHYKSRGRSEHDDREALAHAVMDFMDKADDRLAELNEQLKSQKSRPEPKSKKEEAAEEAERGKADAKKKADLDSKGAKLEKKLHKPG